MKIFDIAGMQAYDYNQREKNVFHKAAGYKMRVIHLGPDGAMPECAMASHVIFVCIAGEAIVTVDGDTTAVSPGQCLVTGPAVVSMKTSGGAQLLGIQISAGDPL